MKGFGERILTLLCHGTKNHKSRREDETKDSLQIAVQRLQIAPPIAIGDKMGQISITWQSRVNEPNQFLNTSFSCNLGVIINK